MIPSATIRRLEAAARPVKVAPVPGVIYNGSQQTFDGPPLDMWTINDPSAPGHGTTFSTQGDLSKEEFLAKMASVGSRGHFPDFVREAVDSGDEEYFDVAGKYVPVDWLQMGEMSAHFMSGGAKTVTMKSDSGNVIVRWKENDEAVFVLGLVSKSGSMGRGDAHDMRTWVNELSDRLRSGKMLITSPNEQSLALIRRVASKLEREGFSIEMENVGGCTTLSAT